MPRNRVSVVTNESFQEYLEGFAETPFAKGVSEAIRRGLDKANFVAAGIIKRKRLTGSGPFPVSQNRLGHRSRRLIRDFDSAPARVIDADKLHVEASMGSNVKYFGGHEFGFSGTVAVRAHDREMPDVDRVSKAGKKFTVPAHKQTVSAHKRKMRIPERAMVRAELKDYNTREIYVDHLEQAIFQNVEDMGS